MSHNLAGATMQTTASPYSNIGGGNLIGAKKGSTIMQQPPGVGASSGLNQSHHQKMVSGSSGA